MELTKSLQDRFPALLLLALFILPFFVRPVASTVWDANEAFYVETPREMVASGNWILPTFDGEPRLNKPPLSYWIIAPFYQAFGVNLLWERLVMAFLAAGSVLILFFVGRLCLARPGSALLAAGILATTFRLVVVSRRLLIDLLLFFLLMAALLALAHWLIDRSPRAFVGACALLGLAFLTKGPVALFPLAALLLFLALNGRLDDLFKAPWIAGGIVLAAISCSWFLVLGVTHGWQAVIDFFMQENLGRYLNVDFGPQRGYFYYVGVYLADFFPWSVLLPAVLVAHARQRRRPFSRDQLSGFFLIWCFVYFIVFSFSLNKQEYYILPIYGPAALLLAGAAATAKPTRWVAGPVAALLVIGGFLLALFTHVLFPSPWFWVPAVLLMLCTWPAWKGRLLWLSAMLSLFFALGAAVYLPDFEAYKPVHALADVIRRETARTAGPWKAGYYRITAPSLRFYLDENILQLFDLPAAADALREPEPVYLITDQTGLDELRNALGNDLPHVVASQPQFKTNAHRLWKILSDPETSDWTSDVLLVTNRAADSP
ncbi:MAG: glycosyltransferase family 39 protein [Acidobacteriota bacterium]